MLQRASLQTSLPSIDVLLHASQMFLQDFKVLSCIGAASCTS